MGTRAFRSLLVALALAAAPSGPATAALDPAIGKALEESAYVYIASTRKDGSLGKPAEIWFFVHEGAVCVGTRPDSWRVKRIRAGRPAAKIWVGRPDGPSFEAAGTIVEDRAPKEALLATFAKKYADRWPQWEEGFRKGLLETGDRTLVCYAPKA